MEPEGLGGTGLMDWIEMGLGRAWSATLTTTAASCTIFFPSMPAVAVLYVATERKVSLASQR